MTATTRGRGDTAPASGSTRPRETAAQRRARLADQTARLARAKTAIQNNEFDAAMMILLALQRDDPSFETADVSAALEAARDGQRRTTQTLGSAAMEEGQQKERAEDFNGAIQSYQRAEKVGGEFTARAASAIVAVKQRQKNAVDELYKRADVDFKFRKPNVLASYQRLLKMMAEDDPRRAEVQARIVELQR
jgi:hypothetical protein